MLEFYVLLDHNRKFKKAMTATATGKSLNKRFDERNNGFSCAL